MTAEKIIRDYNARVRDWVKSVNHCTSCSKELGIMKGYDFEDGTVLCEDCVLEGG